MVRWMISLVLVMLFLGGLAAWRAANRPQPAANRPQPAAPLPLVTGATPSSPARAGQSQPVSPGFRPVAPLPEIALATAIPELRKLEYASNGFIEAAHGLLLVPRAQAQAERLLVLAQAVARGAYAAHPGLASVDLSVYRAEDYAGFGGPSPLFTASVPKARLGGFLRLTARTVDDYNRLWVNPSEPLPPELEPTGATDPAAPEPAPTFEGTPQEIQAQQALQKQQQRGGARLASGLYYHGPPASPRVALTFDDAVHPLYAPLLLDALRRGGAKATFFVVGRNVEAYPYFVRDFAAEGHEMANHTYHHVRLVGLPDAVIRDELVKTNRVIESITGRPVRFFRPPGGRYNAQVLRVVREAGMVTAFWTDDPGDFNNPGGAVIENRSLRYLHPGGIVLLHDNAPQTAPILVDFLNDARAKGLELTTLSGQAGL